MPRAWFECFATFVLKLGFTATRSDSSLFVLCHGCSTRLLQYIVDRLRDEFTIMDMGELRFFLGIDVKRTSDGFYLSQERYAADILEHAGMTNCWPVPTPVDLKGKLSSDGAEIDNAKAYRSLAGALQYLTITRPDLAFAVQQAYLHMHHPRAAHMMMLKRILHYVRGMMSLSLHLCASSELTITA
ncbi:uncharacterized mitochondrial protein AtMg00810-like [Miscanthus floridulus]|uniref:uncharacterized mitochondrial protein AtMg00810-like n=1 Tax=Miscanthus floridulus TaxID=154761 RepID=UPI00345ADE44